MNFKANGPGIEKVFKQIADKIEAVDKKLRDEYTGEPVDAIIGPAGAAFNAAGVNLTPDSVREYAQSVSDNKPFSINLQ